MELRHQLLRRLRAFFDDRGFLEVTTPILSQETVVDRHIDPFTVVVSRHRGTADTGIRFLQSSPELQMKRLLASGVGSIYQVTQAFRASEAGELHNPEFTIAEWYRIGDDLHAGMHLLADLVQSLLGTAAAEYVTYHDAFLDRVGLDPLVASDGELRAAARSSLDPEHHDRDTLLEWLFSEYVQPHVGFHGPTVVHGFPASQAALARISAADDRVSDRFELFLEGMELANGYHELRDAEELNRRFQAANSYRRAAGKESLPIPLRLLQAHRVGLPGCSGTALGFDRLVGFAAGTRKIGDVLCFPWDVA